jgi:hypothetical protein
MNNRSSIHFRIIGVAILTLSAVVSAADKENTQGQYHFVYSPFADTSALSTGNLATYSPIKTIDGKTIKLRSNDGVVYIFTLTADTIYCQGGAKVSDWSYLKSVQKRTSVTVLSSGALNPAALVIWDTGPTISTANNQFDIALPPMCK